MQSARSSSLCGTRRRRRVPQAHVYGGDFVRAEVPVFGGLLQPDGSSRRFPLPSCHGKDVRLQRRMVGSRQAARIFLQIGHGLSSNRPCSAYATPWNARVNAEMGSNSRPFRASSIASS